MKNLNFKRLVDSRRVSDMSRMAYSTNFLQTPEVMALIDDFMLKRTDVRNGNYTLNPQTGKIDVTGNITLSLKGVERLPKYINFGVINGNFTANHINKLVSWFGFPTRVEGDFEVNGSHQPPIHNTDFFPDYVGGIVHIHNLPDIGDIDINTIASGAEPIVDNEFLKQNNMKRIKDSTIPDEWFMNGKAPLLNEPDSQNDTLWKVVLWSGSGYAADPYLFYAPKDFSEWQFEVLVAALDKNGITDYYEDDYYWNNPDIDEELEQSNFEDVYDLMEAYNDIYVDGTTEGANEPHVLRGENLKIEPADEPIEYYTGETISDSRRVKDSTNDKSEFAVAIVGSESMSKSEARKYEKELTNLLQKNVFSTGDYWCQTDWVEPMDWVKGDSVAVWGECTYYADSGEIVDEAIDECTRDWADNNGFDLRVTVQDVID